MNAKQLISYLKDVEDYQVLIKDDEGGYHNVFFWVEGDTVILEFDD